MMYIVAEKVLYHETINISGTNLKKEYPPPKKKKKQFPTMSHADSVIYSAMYCWNGHIRL